MREVAFAEGSIARSAVRLCVAGVDNPGRHSEHCCLYGARDQQFRARWQPPDPSTGQAARPFLRDAEVALRCSTTARLGCLDPDRSGFPCCNLHWCSKELPPPRRVTAPIQEGLLDRSYLGLRRFMHTATFSAGAGICTSGKVVMPRAWEWVRFSIAVSVDLYLLIASVLLPHWWTGIEHQHGL
jgi:hypothetical protein